jgi:predicted Fe-Mo cluster-binding NifX family protein
MKVCVACQSPGGLDADISNLLEESELFDYYDTDGGGEHRLIAQMRRCACADLVEPIIRRKVDAVVVKGLAPGSLLALAHARVHVFIADGAIVKDSLDELVSGGLREVRVKDFASLGGKRK